MKINVEWFDTQEPGPYVVAVQEAWNRLPIHWMRLFPVKTMLFLVSPRGESEMYNSSEFKNQDERIVIILAQECDHEQVIAASLLAFASTFTEMAYVEAIIKLVASRMLQCLEGFTEEEEKLVRNLVFQKQLFLSAFLGSVLGLAGQESSKPFVHKFFRYVDRAVKVSGRRA